MKPPLQNRSQSLMQPNTGLAAKLVNGKDWRASSLKPVDDDLEDLDLFARQDERHMSRKKDGDQEDNSLPSLIR